MKNSLYTKKQKICNFFTDKNEVEMFWKTLWQKEDIGKPDAYWLKEIENLFISIIPNLDENEIEIDDDIINEAIKKKRNWSSPGPNLIVNFWLKKLNSIRKVVKTLFDKFTNTTIHLSNWF